MISKYEYVASARLREGVEAFLPGYQHSLDNAVALYHSFGTFSAPNRISSGLYAICSRSVASAMYIAGRLRGLYSMLGPSLGVVGSSVRTI